MAAQGSKDELLQFLEYTAEKGLLKKSTAQSLKVACNNVLSILDEGEEANVLEIDLDDLFQRFANIKAMEVRPGTLRSYRQRVAQAVSDFQRYKEDPENWKPAAAQRSTRANTSKRSKDRAPRPETAPNESSQSIAGQPVAVDEIVHRFPLRPDAIVHIWGVPYDVNKSEATRLANFLHTLVADTDPAGHSPRMLAAPAHENN